MTGFCKSVIPQTLRESLEKLKGKPEELYQFGAEYILDLCVKVLSAKDENGQYLMPGLHIYTMDSKKCTIELLSACKKSLGMNAELTEVIDTELKRVLAEDEKIQKKRVEKNRKLEEEIKLLTNLEI